MADDTLATEIRELHRDLAASGYASCDLKAEGRRLYLRVPRAPAPAPAPSPQEVPAGAPAEPEGGTLLRSPRVGHFYPRTSQGQGPGTRLEAGEVYGTIEAMHLKYELRADKPGVIREFLAAEGEAVEYGQPLVALEPGG